MSTAETILAEANALFVDEDFENALKKFSEAIEQNNSVSDYYVKRSFCYYKLENYTASLTDANKAISLDANNSKAYFRKGQAAFSLEDYETAKAAFEKSQELASNSTNKTWIRKCDAELAERKGTEATLPKEEKSEKKPEATHNTQPVLESLKPVEPPKAQNNPRFRHEWFQTATHVDVSLFAKGLKSEDVSVTIEKQTLEIVIKLPSSSEFQLHIDLASEVIPAESNWKLLSTKIEVKLKKLHTAKWPSLEDTGTKIKTWDVVSDGKPTGLTYPTSSKHGVKNWDKLVDEEVKDEKLDGDAALNKVFQDIYKGASDEQRRAMMKSFVESSGTVLSTNWDEVGKAPVKGSPPKGMDMKDWKDLHE